MRSRDNRELWLAFIAIAAITLFYGFMVAMLGGVPPAVGVLRALPRRYRILCSC